MILDEMNPKEYREKLIDEVKKYPVLYDTRHENHRDIDVRDRCWNQISEKIGENSEILKREWKILRDSFRQAMKKSKEGTKTKAGAPCKRWRFQNRMSFVLPYMTIRRNQRRTNEDVEIKIDQTEVQSEHEGHEPEVWDPGHGDEDSLDLFFASVCQSTKRLPRKYQNQIKKQVLDILLKVEEEHESEGAETKVFKNSF